jgi:hypothetical protein
VLITIGFTQSDRSRDYSSFSDGYRIGAHQVSVTIALEGDGDTRSAPEWADAVFVASNTPQWSVDPLVAGIQHAMATQAGTGLRSLSVGDTVTVHGQMWACDPGGWHQVDARPN